MLGKYRERDNDEGNGGGHDERTCQNADGEPLSPIGHREVCRRTR